MYSEDYSEDNYTKLNDIETVLTKLGIKLRENAGTWRDIDDVLDDIGEKWNTWDTTTQNAVATTIAGTRQRENVVTLFENWDSVADYAEIAEDSFGNASTKMEAYTSSVEASKNALTNAVLELTLNLNQSETLKSFYDSLTSLTQHLGTVITVLAGFATFKFFSGGNAGTMLGKGASFLSRQTFGNIVDSTVSQYIANNKIGGYTYSGKNQGGILDQASRAINAEYNTKLYQAYEAQLLDNTTTLRSEGQARALAIMSLIANTEATDLANMRTFLMMTAEGLYSTSLWDQLSTLSQDLLATAVLTEAKRTLSKEVLNTILGENDVQKADYILTHDLLKLDERVVKLGLIFGGGYNQGKDKGSTAALIGTGGALGGMVGGTAGYSIMSNLTGNTGLALAGSMLGSYAGKGVIGGLLGVAGGEMTYGAAAAQAVGATGAMASIVGPLTGVLGGVMLVLGVASAIKKNNEELLKLAQEEFTASKEEYTTAKSQKSTARKYEELSKGVNDLGQNISLSDDDYQSYLEYGNQLGEVFPELIKFTDAEGNSIIDLTKIFGDGEELTKNFSETILYLIDQMREATSRDLLNGDLFKENLKNAKEERNTAKSEYETGKLILGGSYEVFKANLVATNLWATEADKEWIKNNHLSLSTTEKEYNDLKQLIEIDYNKAQAQTRGNMKDTAVAYAYVQGYYDDLDSTQLTLMNTGLSKMSLDEIDNYADFTTAVTQMAAAMKRAFTNSEVYDNYSNYLDATNAGDASKYRQGFIKNLVDDFTVQGTMDLTQAQLDVLVNLGYGINNESGSIVGMSDVNEILGVLSDSKDYAQLLKGVYDNIIGDNLGNVLAWNYKIDQLSQEEAQNFWNRREGITSNMSWETVKKLIQSDYIPTSYELAKLYKEATYEEGENFETNINKIKNLRLDGESKEQLMLSINETFIDYPYAVREAIYNAFEDADTPEEIEDAVENIMDSYESTKLASDLLVAKTGVTQFFSDIDKDGDGAINTFEELDSAIEHISTTTNALHTAMKQMATDGRVSFDTFFSAIKEDINNIDLFNIDASGYITTKTGSDLQASQALIIVDNMHYQVLNLQDQIESVQEKIDNRKALGYGDDDAQIQDWYYQIEVLEKKILGFESVGVYYSKIAKQMADSNNSFGVTLSTIDSNGNGVIDTLSEITTLMTTMLDLASTIKEVTESTTSHNFMGMEDYLELIDKYPELANRSDLITVGAGGAYIKDEEALNLAMAENWKKSSIGSIDRTISENKSKISTNDSTLEKYQDYYTINDDGTINVNSAQYATDVGIPLSARGIMENEVKDLISKNDELETLNNNLEIKKQLIEDIDAELLAENNSWQKITEKISSAVSGYNKVKDALKEQKSKGHLTFSTVAEMMAEDTDYIKLLDPEALEDGMLKLVSNPYEKLFSIKKDEMLASIQGLIDTNLAKIDQLTAEENATNDMEASEEDFTSIVGAETANRINAMLLEENEVLSLAAAYATLNELKTSKGDTWTLDDFMLTYGKHKDEVSTEIEESREQAEKEAKKYHTTENNNTSSQITEDRKDLEDEQKLLETLYDAVSTSDGDKDFWNNILGTGDDGNYTKLDKLKDLIAMLNKEYTQMKALEEGITDVEGTREYVSTNYYEKKRALLNEEIGLLNDYIGDTTTFNTLEIIGYKKDLIEAEMQLKKLDMEKAQDDIDYYKDAYVTGSLLTKAYKQLVDESSKFSNVEKVKAEKQYNEQLHNEYELLVKLYEYQNKLANIKLKYITPDVDGGYHQNYKELQDNYKEIMDAAEDEYYRYYDYVYKEAINAGASATEAASIAEQNSDVLSAAEKYYEAAESRGDAYYEEIKGKLDRLNEQTQLIEDSKPQEWASIDQIREFADKEVTIYQKELDEFASTVDDMKYMTDDQILELVNGYNEAYKKIKEIQLQALEDEKAYKDETYNAITTQVDEYISDLQKQKEIMEDYYDTEIEKLQDKETSIERTNRLLELQNNLLDAQQEKSRQYRAGVGWVKNMPRIKED